MNCEFLRTSSAMFVIQVNFTQYLSLGINFLNFWFLYMIRRKITFFSLVLLFLPKVTEIILKFISIRSLLKCINSTIDNWNRKLKHQASLSIINSRSLLKLMSIESVMPSNHLILCHPLLLSPSIFPSIRVFSNESAL